MTDRISILVVEDEAIVLMDVADQLEAEGFRVYTAFNADVAIELMIAHIDIRLVFTDIDMPGTMNGLKLVEAVRKRWPPVKLIVTSGHHVVNIAGLPKGSVFISKPYLHSAVLGSMNSLLAA